MFTSTVIVVGASAGGVEAFTTLVEALPADLPAALFLVLHTPAHSRSHLPEILQRRSVLPVAHGQDGAPIEQGRIYVAPPDHHLVVGEERVRLTRGPRENHSRPAVDVLFRSAAYHHGARTVGVVLTGTLDDGTAGLWAIKDRGGVAVVQRPDEALHAGMPESAIAHVSVDHVVPVTQMGGLLSTLARAPRAAEETPMSQRMEREVRIAENDPEPLEDVLALGPVSAYSCPDCHGVMVRVDEGILPRFRCHTGHAYSAHSLLAKVTERVDEELWSAIRALDESTMLSRELAAQLRTLGTASTTADQLDQSGREAQERARTIRAVLRMPS